MVAKLSSSQHGNGGHGRITDLLLRLSYAEDQDQDQTTIHHHHAEQYFVCACRSGRPKLVSRQCLRMCWGRTV